MSDTGCRICGSARRTVVLSLGSTPLANALITSDRLGEPEDRFPLDLAFCPDCSLVQILETVPPDRLFRDYAYFSSYSDTMLRHAKAIAQRLIAERGLNGRSLVVEIASNDGYLLQFFQEAGIPVLGIEPARNIASVACRRGVPTLDEFFGEQLAQQLAGERRAADVIIGNNVLAHISDLNGFVRGVACLVTEDGIAQFEVPYVRDLIDNCEFDTIYHEHLCYYSLTALQALFMRHDLRVVDCERIAIHGGSLRVQAARAGAAQATAPRVSALLDEERSWGVSQLEPYAMFGARVRTLGDKLRALLYDLRRGGRRLAAYGAAAKGSTLLNCFGIGADMIDFVADRSPHKQGRYMPGVRIPIVSPEQLLEQMPDYTLLLTWNFADEILSQQAEYIRRGGRFILPVPEPMIAS